MHLLFPTPKFHTSATNPNAATTRQYSELFAQHVTILGVMAVFVAPATTYLLSFFLGCFPLLVTGLSRRPYFSPLVHPHG